MSTRLKLAAGAAGTLLVICLFVIATRSSPEPMYQGLTMSDAPYIRSPQAREAVLVLGTNNLPLLVNRLRYDPKKDILALFFTQLYRLSGSPWINNIASRRSRLADSAAAIFWQLGPRAVPAIPELARIVEHGGQTPSWRAMGILAGLGDEGLAILATRAALRDAESREFAVKILAGHIDSGAARSGLKNALNDPDPNVRALALRLCPKPLQ